MYMSNVRVAKKSADLDPSSNICVVIATCNRSELLDGLISNLMAVDYKLLSVIIIDSSDKVNTRFNRSKYNFDLEYIHVEVKSAAIQRNIGLSKVPKTAKYVAFLDDDVRVGLDYFEKMIENFSKTSAIGIAPYVISMKDEILRSKPYGFEGIFKKTFLLDSVDDGVLLSSGVNIPVRVQDQSLLECEWLIGCAVWKYEIVSHLRFPENFLGSSIGEDVIFSSNASEFGNLYVDSNLKIDHFESETNRLVGSDFWRMWTRNRLDMVELISGRKVRYPAVHLANLGQFILVIIKSLSKRKTDLTAFLGIPLGYLDFYLGRKNLEN